MSLNATELKQLLEVVFPGLVLLVLVGGFAFRITIKPTVDALLKLREGIRSDREQGQQRIAQLEDEVARLRAGDSRVPPALDDGSWSKHPVRRD